MNGRLDPAGMTAVDGHHRMHPAAAIAFLAMRTALFLATGVWIGITEAYRTYAEQERYFRARYTPGHSSGIWWAGTYWRKLPWVPAAAVPGTSNHGWGLALDINNYGPTNGTVFRWLLDHAGAFGFSWAEGRNVNEPWHWVYVGSLTMPATSGIVAITTDPEHEEEDTMKSIQIHEVIDGKIGRRALLTPGTAYFVPFSGGQAGRIANDLAGTANTGTSIAVPPELFDHFEARAKALEPK